MSALTFCREHLAVVRKLVYLGHCVSAGVGGGGVLDEINLRIMKTRPAYAGQSHFYAVVM